MRALLSPSRRVRGARGDAGTIRIRFTQDGDRRHRTCDDVVVVDVAGLVCTMLGGDGFGALPCLTL